jgi:CRP/FNR family transcriptional regulator, cyclic AMP receptor protein
MLLGRYSLKGLTPTNPQDARRVLCDCVLFRKLEPPERHALAARAHMRSFDAGDTIFLMGTLHDSMIAVLEGEVRISVPSAEGKEVVLAIVHAGEVFGEIAMLDGKPRSADAKALTGCNVAVLDRRDVLEQLGPAIARGLLFLGLPLHGTIDPVESYLHE